MSGNALERAQPWSPCEFSPTLPRSPATPFGRREPFLFDYLATYESSDVVSRDLIPALITCSLRESSWWLTILRKAQTFVGASPTAILFESANRCISCPGDRPRPFSTDFTTSEMKTIPHRSLYCTPNHLLDDDFEALVTTMQQLNIAAGDIYQVAPSRGFIADCPNALHAFAR